MVLIFMLFWSLDLHKEMPCLVINMNKGDVVMHEDQVSRWLILAAFSAVDVKVILIS